MKNLKKQFQHQNQTNEIQKDSSSSKKNKKKMTIRIRLGKFDFNFFNEISIIQKAIGIDLNKTMIFLMINYLEHLFDLKDNNLNDASINCEKVKKNFFDYELKKDEIKKTWSINRSKLIDFRIASFGKLISFNLYKEKKKIILY